MPNQFRTPIWFWQPKGGRALLLGHHPKTARPWITNQRTAVSLQCQARHRQKAQRPKVRRWLTEWLRRQRKRGWLFADWRWQEGTLVVTLQVRVASEGPKALRALSGLLARKASGREKGKVRAQAKALRFWIRRPLTISLLNLRNGLSPVLDLAEHERKLRQLFLHLCANSRKIRLQNSGP